jgi:integrase
MNTSFYASDGRRRSLIQKQKSGAWYLRFKQNGRGVWRSTGSNELHVAKEKARKLFDSITNAQVLDTDTSFDQLLQRFLDTRQGRAEHTRACDKAFAGILRNSFPMQTLARNVRPGDLLGWLARQRTLRKWKGRTYNAYRLWLRQMFNLAQADRLITRDQHPFANPDLIKREREDHVVRNIPTPEQFEAIIADVRANHVGAADEIADMLQFLGLAGVGQAEARALRRCDVGAKMKFIRRKTGRPFEVPIYEWVQSLVERRCAMVQDPGALLFTQQDCGVALREACARLGLTRFTQRGFRAMLIKRLYDAGVPVKRIALWQGHRDGGKLIMTTYTEVFCDTDAAAEQADLARIGCGVIRVLPDHAVVA